MINKFTVPLTSEAYYLAENFQANHHDAKKARKIYLNTLAVYAGNFYCKFMDIETNWQNSDSAKLTNQILMDTADLELANLGKLECRPILPNQELFKIPEEARKSDRLGCLLIEINEEEKKAIITKFCQQKDLPKDRDSVVVEHLKSLDSFLDYVEELEENLLAKTSIIITKITSWFENIYTDGWQTINSLFDDDPYLKHKLAMGFRSRGKQQETEQNSIQIAKIINIDDQELVLCADTKLLSNQKIDVIFRLYSKNQNHLPSNLKVSVLDDSEEKKVLKEKKSLRDDDLIKIGLNGKVGEKFNLDIQLNEKHIVERFQI